MSEFLPTGIQMSYLVAASLFIVGLKQLGSPATARQGNVIASVGMLVAIRLLRTSGTFDVIINGVKTL